VSGAGGNVLIFVGKQAVLNLNESICPIVENFTQKPLHMDFWRDKVFT
jgi:hypothetical protein